MRIAIVGAGLTGLTAGRALARRGHEVVLYEKSRGLGGRAATRRLNGCIIDHGAQYLKLPDDAPNVRRLVREEISTEGLRDIGRPVWTFDRSGHVHEGDAEHNASPKWTYADGLTTLAKRLGEGLEIQRNTRISRLERVGKGLRLVAEVGGECGLADRVLITVPAPQAVELLQSSAIEAERCRSALAELDRTAYRPVFSVMLAYRQPAGDVIFAGGNASDPRPYYALVALDRAHPISWLAIENDKEPGRAPAGVLMVVAQMGAAFSREQYERSPDEIATMAAAKASTLLHADLGQPLWHDLARWRYALPDATCDLSPLNQDAHGVYLAGDYVAGGRLHLAMQAGLDVAGLIEGE